MSMDRGRPSLRVALSAALMLSMSSLADTATAAANPQASTPPAAPTAEPMATAPEVDSGGADLFPEISAPGHTATLLPDGRVLLIGAGSTARSAELWDPGTGRSERAGTLEEPREYHTATLLMDGRVLVVGGRDAIVDAVVWDPSILTFSETEGTPRSWRLDGQTATLLPDGGVLVIGGEDYDSIAGAEVWDPGTGKFSSTGGNAARRTDHTATLLPGGRALVVGGWDDIDRFGSPLGDAVLWDPETGMLSPAGTLQHARSGHTATLLPDGRVLVFGGEGKSGESLDSAEVWDPGIKTFSRAGALSSARSDHTATLLPDGRVLVIGGRLDASGPLSSVEAWDPASTSFSPVGSLEEARYGHTSTLLPDGRVLVIGGETAYDATAEIWDPTTRSSEIQPAIMPRPTRLAIEVELGTMIEGAGWQPYRKSPAGVAFDPFEYGARTGVIFDLVDDLYPTIDYAVLFRFDDAADLERYWDARGEAVAKQAPGRDDPCADGEPGRGTWDEGELLCYVSDSDTALLRWTDEGTNTYGVVNARPGRNNLKALHRQWRAALGGIVTGVEDDVAKKAKFNARERVLLQGVPADIAKTCVPWRSQNPKGTVAAVQCKPKNPDVREIAYYLMPMKQAVQAFRKRKDTYIDDLDAMGLQRCAEGKPSWDFGIPFGHSACYRDEDGRAHLSFVDSAAGCKQLDVGDKRLQEPAVYIAVLGENRNIAKLYDWGGRVLWKDPDQPGVPYSSLCPG